MTRLIRFDEIPNIKSTNKEIGVATEYLNREHLKGNMGKIDWDKFDGWCQTYYIGYLAEKYVYDHCPEVKPIDPDWEYLCHMEHFGSHTYDCTYKGISAEVKYCWLNNNPKHPEYIYVRTCNKSVDKLMHKASLVISSVGDNVAYAFTCNYKEVTISGKKYYQFPIEGYIYKKYIV